MNIPFTKRKVVGVLPFGTDSESLSIANKELKTLFLGNSLYSSYKNVNPELLYIVFWVLLQRGGLFAADEVLRYRCENKRSFISLTGNHQMGLVSASIKTGIWWVLSAWKSQGGTPGTPSGPSPFHFHIYNIKNLVTVWNHLTPSNHPLDVPQIYRTEDYLRQVFFLSHNHDRLLETFKVSTLFNGYTPELPGVVTPDASIEISKPTRLSLLTKSMTQS